MASHRKPSAQTYDPRTVKEHIVETPLNEEMSKSFLEYAYSVIYARALPDARDGLKPVQRRIVYQMGEMNLTPDRPYMKSARVVGEVMGKLHPHGDSAIYEAMVRLAQPFAMRLPLVDGHGNFGSLDDGPAASRYTEARLGPAALGMNADIDEDTVDFTPNYDNKLKEPTVLPAAIPNLLVNGGSGIAVGMATNLATHNLGEVVNAAKFLMAHSDATLEQLMRYVPGPDWPTGGTIIGRDGIREAYATGRGTLTTRAATHIEHVTARKQAIVVTELPYMVGPEKVIERISDGVKNRKLEGISGAFDLTDRHNGTRIVIEIKTGFDPHAVLVQLFKHTPLQDNFAMNNVALVEGRPHTMGLKEMLQVWVDHRRVVIRRRSEYRKKKALERLHLVEGLLLAMLDIDEVIQVIRTSDDADAAKSRLMVVFDLDEVQAQYILDLRLRRLTKMNRIELEAERDDLKKRIEELTRILASAEARPGGHRRDGRSGRQVGLAAPYRAAGCRPGWHVDAGRGAGCRGFGRVQVRARSGEGRHYDLLRRSRCGRSRSCGQEDRRTVHADRSLEDRGRAVRGDDERYRFDCPYHAKRDGRVQCTIHFR